MNQVPHSSQNPELASAEDTPSENTPQSQLVPEIGGRGGPDPTRYGDWEKNGRCIDFSP
ncbi:MAG: DUF1674 domain-containing protein [Arenimonas sp.]|jgi:hypothetical protein|nr:DUF1674 domain-containing protein [Arenimonas sp.]